MKHPSAFDIVLFVQFTRSLDSADQEQMIMILSNI